MARTAGSRFFYRQIAIPRTHSIRTQAAPREKPRTGRRLANPPDGQQSLVYFGPGAGRGVQDFASDSQQVALNRTARAGFRATTRAQTRTVDGQ